MTRDCTGGRNLARFTSSHESKGSRVWLRGSNIVNPRNGPFLYLSRFIQTNFSHEYPAWFFPKMTKYLEIEIFRHEIRIIMKNFLVLWKLLRILISTNKNWDWELNHKLIILGARNFSLNIRCQKHFRISFWTGNRCAILEFTKNGSKTSQLVT